MSDLQMKKLSHQFLKLPSELPEVRELVSEKVSIQT